MELYNYVSRPSNQQYNILLCMCFAKYNGVDLYRMFALDHVVCHMFTLESLLSGISYIWTPLFFGHFQSIMYIVVYWQQGLGSLKVYVVYCATNSYHWLLRH